MSGGMEQKRLHKSLDDAFRMFKERRVERFRVSLTLVKSLYDPMGDKEHDTLRLAQAFGRLRNADEYFTVHGHLTLAVRRWGLQWRMDPADIGLLIFERAGAACCVGTEVYA